MPGRFLCQATLSGRYRLVWGKFVTIYCVSPCANLIVVDGVLHWTSQPVRAAAKRLNELFGYPQEGEYHHEGE